MKHVGISHARLIPVHLHWLTSLSNVTEDINYVHCEAIAHSGRLRGQADAGSVALRTLFKAGWDTLRSLLCRLVSPMEKKEEKKDTTEPVFSHLHLTISTPESECICFCTVLKIK